MTEQVALQVAEVIDAPDLSPVVPVGTKLPARRSRSLAPVEAYLARLSPGSRRSMVGALTSVLAILRGDRLADLDRPERRALRRQVRASDWSALDSAKVNLIRRELEAVYSATHANKCLSAVKGVLRECWRAGLLDRDAYARAVDVPAVKAQSEESGRWITPGEKLALLNACDDDESLVGLRDAVMLTLGWGVGCRVAEIAGLDFGDYNPETGEVKITGKGNKTRVNWAIGGIPDALADWTEVRGSEPGPMFYAVNPKGELVTERRGDPARLSTWAIQKRLKARAAEARVAPFAWHDLRRTFITDAFEAGVDAVLISKWVGHSSVETTMRYDRRPARARREAMSRLVIPYNRRSRITPK